MAEKTGFEDKSVDDLRKLLVKKYGLTVEQAAVIKPKSAVVAKIQELAAKAKPAPPQPEPDGEIAEFEVEEDINDINLEAFGMAEEVEEKSSGDKPKPKAVVITQNDLQAEPVDSIPENDRPSQFSPQWSDFVMTHFIEEELVGGNPTVDGLRRVAQLLLGPIVWQDARVDSTPCFDNRFRAATVTFWCDIEKRDHSVVRFVGVASVSTSNTGDPYVTHPASTAETKAEGRALKRALGLRKVYAAEELSDNVAEDIDVFDPDAKITNELRFAIDLVCKTNQINVMSFVNSGKATYEHIDDVPFKVAKRMFEHLNSYGNGEKEIPEAIKGYKSGWYIPKPDKENE